jgi:hypothetical protein
MGAFTVLYIYAPEVQNPKPSLCREMIAVI